MSFGETNANPDAGIAIVEIEILRELSRTVTTANAFNNAATRLQTAATRISLADSGIEIHALNLKQEITREVNDALNDALNSIRRHGNQSGGHTADSPAVTRPPDDCQPGEPC